MSGQPGELGEVLEARVGGRAAVAREGAAGRSLGAGPLGSVRLPGEAGSAAGPPRVAGARGRGLRSGAGPRPPAPARLRRRAGVAAGRRGPWRPGAPPRLAGLEPRPRSPENRQEFGWQVARWLRGGGGVAEVFSPRGEVSAGI